MKQDEVDDGKRPGVTTEDRRRIAELEKALDALEMALWPRRQQELDGLVHHSDRVQYLAIR